MSALKNQHQPTLSVAECLADLAVEVLIDEVDLSPKPGLVDRRGNGAHDDLHRGLMHASALSLWPAFKEMAQAAAEQSAVNQSLRDELGRLGREAEAEMLRVTRGVNTHRGAIWALGLLCAGAALDSQATSAAEVTLRAARIAMLNDRALPAAPESHGAQVCRLYGLPGAREQAQLGFPAVMQHGLPQLHRSREAQSGEQNSRLDALLSIMTQLTDTCVLYRAGMAGLDCMQSGARAVIAAGGCASLDGRRLLRDLDNDMLRLRASPGGAADLLAVTLFLDRLTPALQAQIGSV